MMSVPCVANVLLMCCECVANVLLMCAKNDDVGPMYSHCQIYIYIFAAYNARHRLHHPLQNCRLYYSQIQRSLNML